MDFIDKMNQLAGITPGSTFNGALDQLTGNVAVNNNNGTVTGPVAPPAQQIQQQQAQPTQAAYTAPASTMPAPAPAVQLPGQPQAPVNVSQPSGPIPPTPQGMPGGAQPGVGQTAPMGPAQTPVVTGQTAAMPQQNPVAGAVAPQNAQVPTAVNPAAASPAVLAAAGAPTNGQTTNVVTPQDLMGNQIFNQMLHTESGNQNYLPNGQPVTSAAGAKYAAQVMPATAANPGYGIRPAQNDSPAEFNRVGKEYHEAMRKKYNDEEKAVAAYNAGPGRVDHAIKLAEQNGGSWKDYLPAETKQYLAKVNPSAIQQQIANVNNGEMGPTKAEAMTGNKAHDTLIAAGNDPQRLSEIAFDNTGKYDDATKKAANQSMLDMLTHGQGMEKARNEMKAGAQSGNMLPVLNKANQKTPEGSRFRAMLYELAGAKQAAADEYNKLGVGSSWQHGMLMGPDNKLQHYAVYMTPDGEAKRAINSATGEEITDQKTLSTLNGGGMGGTGMKSTGLRQGATTGNTYEVMSDKNGNTFYRNAKTGEISPTLTENLVNVGTKTLSRQEQEQAMKAKNAFIAAQDKLAVNSGGWEHHPTYRSRQEMLDAAEQQHQSMLSGNTQIPSMANEAVAPTTPGVTANEKVTPVNPNAPTTPPLRFRSFNQNDPIDVQAREALYGRAAPPTAGRTGQSAAQSNAVQRRIYELAENEGVKYNPTKFKDVVEPIVKSFATGDDKKSVDSLKTAFNHAGEFDAAIDAAGNGKYPLANSLMNKFEIARGSEKGINVQSVDQIGPILGNEVEKTWNPKMGTGAEREHIVNQFNSAKSPEALHKAVDNYKDLMMGKVKPLQDRYEQTGLTDFWKNQINDNEIKTRYDKWNAKENNRTGQSASGTTSTGVKFKVIQ